MLSRLVAAAAAASILLLYLFPQFNPRLLRLLCANVSRGCSCCLDRLLGESVAVLVVACLFTSAAWLVGQAGAAEGVVLAAEEERNVMRHVPTGYLENREI